MTMLSTDPTTAAAESAHTAAMRLVDRLDDHYWTLDDGPEREACRAIEDGVRALVDELDALCDAVEGIAPRLDLSDDLIGLVLAVESGTRDWSDVLAVVRRHDPAYPVHL